MSGSKNQLTLEAADGFSAVEGVLSLLPTYITESVAGELSEDEAGKGQARR